MLYDPKWATIFEVKADPFSLESLIAWLEKQPADKTYDYGCNGHCLLAQYFTAMGFKDVCVGGTHFDHRRDGRRAFVCIPQNFGDIAIDRHSIFGNGTDRKDRTFGGALKRARYLASLS
ncbi:hypothetical protein V1290_000009 [Bradyrhizobium sp. AZCC 1578]|uniref:hypothetical protein n=1 Tax=Bradyrhizobium sp. AZCC 1578 TaxID=3117027 RepID=UPI002FEF59DE